MPNVSYGEDYAVGLAISRYYQIGRIYEPLYLCRRWDENSDAALDIVRANTHNYYKDKIRTTEFLARKQVVIKGSEQLSYRNMDYSKSVENLFVSQTTEWDLARDNYKQLENVTTRSISFEKFELLVQFNPGRITSSAAKVDTKSIEARPCFPLRKKQAATAAGTIV